MMLFPLALYAVAKDNYRRALNVYDGQILSSTSKHRHRRSSVRVNRARSTRPAHLHWENENEYDLFYKVKLKCDLH